MKLDEIRGLAEDELKRKAESTYEELFKLRYQAVAESVENTKSIRALRKTVARIKTVLRERELASAKSE